MNTLYSKKNNNIDNANYNIIILILRIVEYFNNTTPRAHFLFL
jgi:hypothetical protein